MELILERGDDAKIPTAAAQTPEEVSVLGGTGHEQFAVGGDDIGREQIIAAQTTFPRQPAKATAEGEPGDTGIGDRATGGGQAEGLCFMIEFSPGHPAFSACCASLGIDPDAAHARQVDHQAPVAYRIAGDVMAATAH